VAAPLPIASPALGTGIVPVLSYIFLTSTSAKASSASVIGAVGLVTDNGTRALALGGEIYFGQDAYRITSAYCRGNLNYDLFGLGSGNSQARLSLEQTGQLVFAEFLRRSWWKILIGPRFFWGSSLIAQQSANSETAPLPADIGLNTTLTSIGFGLYRDTRPN